MLHSGLVLSRAVAVTSGHGGLVPSSCSFFLVLTFFLSECSTQGWFYRELRQSLVDMEDLFQLLKTPSLLPDGALPLPDAPPATAAAAAAAGREALSSSIEGGSHVSSGSNGSGPSVVQLGQQAEEQQLAEERRLSNGAASTSGATVPSAVTTLSGSSSSSSRNASSSSSSSSSSSGPTRGLRLELRAVHFSYPSGAGAGGGRQVLRGVSLAAEPGESIAVVGELPLLPLALPSCCRVRCWSFACGMHWLCDAAAAATLAICAAHQASLAKICSLCMCRSQRQRQVHAAAPADPPLRLRRRARCAAWTLPVAALCSRDALHICGLYIVPLWRVESLAPICCHASPPVPALPGLEAPHWPWLYHLSTTPGRPLLAVLLNGVDVRQLQQDSLRGAVAVVPQVGGCVGGWVGGSAHGSATFNAHLDNLPSSAHICPHQCTNLPTTVAGFAYSGEQICLQRWPDLPTAVSKFAHSGGAICPQRWPDLPTAVSKFAHSCEQVCPQL